MRPRRFSFLTTFAALALGALNARGDGGPLILHYNEPAQKWDQALPVGNGRLGAMIFGGTAEERLQVNEDTVWAGEPHDYAHKGAVKYLPEIRRLLFEGKQREAEALAEKQFMSVPLGQKPYQPFVDLKLTFDGHDQVENYRRELDLDTATAAVEYGVKGVTYRREVFASFPDQVIVVRLTSSQPGKLNFEAGLSSPHRENTVEVHGDTILLRGQVGRRGGGNSRGEPSNAIRFEARLKVLTDRSPTPTANGLQLKGASSATLILVGATNFKTYKDVSADPSERREKALAAASRKTFDDLRKAHVADHQRLFRRVSLDLGTTDSATLPTDQRLKAVAKQPDPALAALFFQYGRYLMIACSRPGGQPANLQGLWNDSLGPPWDSKWTVNINTEMNYWPVEVTNLSECAEPLFDLIADCSRDGPGGRPRALRRAGLGPAPQYGPLARHGPDQRLEPRHLGHRRCVALPPSLGPLPLHGRPPVSRRTRLPDHEGGVPLLCR